MSEPRLRVVVAGLPRSPRDPDRRSLRPAHAARFEGVSPRIELAHACRDEPYASPPPGPGGLPVEAPRVRPGP